jgi:hypothetical protein
LKRDKSKVKLKRLKKCNRIEKTGFGPFLKELGECVGKISERKMS